MKLSKKVTFACLGLGLVIAVGTTQLAPTSTQGSQKVSYEELEKELASTKKELKETKAALELATTPTESEKNAMILEPNKPYKVNELGDFKSGEKIAPGIYTVVLEDPKDEGTLYTFAEGSPQDYEHYKSFASLGEDVEIDSWTFVVDPKDTIVIDVPAKMIRTNN